jgi:hypothetical protein
VKSVHRTAENIAAALHPGVGDDSELAAVKEALRQLEAAQKVRRGDDGYRIPTPAEDDWERLRNGLSPKPGDAHRLYSETLAGFWQPEPSYTLEDAKTFKAGLVINGRPVVDGDMMFQIHLAEEGQEIQGLVAELRTRSQQERKVVFWAVSVNHAIDRETVELFRSKEMLTRKEREARTSDETALVGEEKVRLRQHQDELRRLLRVACLSGSVYFRGNDRSPGDRAADVGKSASEILGHVLPEVFDRFKEAAARTNDVKKGLDALFTAENLQGLPMVFRNLRLLSDEKGKTIFRVDSGPLAEVMSRIEERANYGDTASGKLLADEFAKEPFGWDFEVVRLLVLSLLRAGKIDATSKGLTIDSATELEARDAFSNNNVFRATSFRPKKGVKFEELVKASEAFRDTFGTEVRELNTGAIVSELRAEIAGREDVVVSACELLKAHRLPGANVLEGALGEMKAILRGSDDNAISTFNASHRAVKDAIKRASEIGQALSEPRLLELEHARQALATEWQFLGEEKDISDELRAKASALKDLMARETFYRDLASIERNSGAIEMEYSRRYEGALRARVEVYTRALEKLVQTPGWTDLEQEQQARISAPLKQGVRSNERGVPIAQMRSEREACDSRLRSAITEIHRIINGERLVTVSLSSYFAGGVETDEQLEAALAGIREECERLIGAGKKVIVQ